MIPVVKMLCSQPGQQGAIHTHKTKHGTTSEAVGLLKPKFAIVDVVLWHGGEIEPFEVNITHKGSFDGENYFTIKNVKIDQDDRNTAVYNYFAELPCLYIRTVSNSFAAEDKTELVSTIYNFD